MNAYINISESVASMAQQLIATDFAGTALAGVRETNEDYPDGLTIDEGSFVATDLPEPDDFASDGCESVSAYNLPGCALFIVRGDNNALHFCGPEMTIRDLLISCWDTGDQEWAEFMAGWGFSGEYDPAEEGDTDVRIWVEKNYYHGTLGAPADGYRRDDGHTMITFDTFDLAQEWITDQESEDYCLSNGEADRPAYTICK